MNPTASCKAYLFNGPNFDYFPGQKKKVLHASGLFGSDDREITFFMSNYSSNLYIPKKMYGYNENGTYLIRPKWTKLKNINHINNLNYRQRRAMKVLHEMYNKYLTINYSCQECKYKNEYLLKGECYKEYKSVYDTE